MQKQKPPKPVKPANLSSKRSVDMHIPPTPPLQERRKVQLQSMQKMHSMEDLHESSSATLSIPMSYNFQHRRASYAQSSGVTLPIYDHIQPSRNADGELPREFDASKIEQNHKEQETIISEIITTEKHYLNDLLILKEDFIQPAYDRQVLPLADLKLVFGNIDPIINVSTDLLMEFKRDPRAIGKVFMLHMDDIRTCYGTYCKNNQDSLERIVELQKDAAFAEYLQSCQSSMRNKTDAWDLSSLIIKPVQRVLKYPLLLTRLLKHTPETDMDYQNLESSSEAILKVAELINDLKKRKELVEKYTLGKGPVNVIHGFNKKISRGAQKLLTVTGIEEYTPDPMFLELNEKFNTLQSKRNLIEQQIKDYLTKEKLSLQEHRNLAVYIRDLAITHPSLPKYQAYLSCIETILNTHFKVLGEEVTLTALKLLQKVESNFRGPALIIKKRAEKELDHIRFIQRTNQGEAIDESLKSCSDDFHALHTQLCEELPIFMDACLKSFQIVLEMIGEARLRFLQRCIEVQRDFVYNYVDREYSGGFESIVDTFNSQMDLNGPVCKHASPIKLIRKWTEKMWDLGPNFNPNESTESITSIYGSQLSRYSQVDSSQVGSRVEPTKLIALYDFEPAAEDELQLVSGDILTLLRGDDPSGLWLMAESHRGRGYVPSSYVQQQ